MEREELLGLAGTPRLLPERVQMRRSRTLSSRGSSGGARERLKGLFALHPGFGAEPPPEEDVVANCDAWTRSCGYEDSPYP